MSDETNFPEIEQRLLAEAQCLLAAKGTHPSAARLSGVYEQRQRRRAVRAAATASGVVALIAAGLVVGLRHGETGSVRPKQPIVADVGQEHSKQKLSILTTDSADESPVIIPFVIGDATAGEEIISGIYVPEQAEPIDELDLSPGERDAVRAVLGIEGQDGVVFQPI